MDCSNVFRICLSGLRFNSRIGVYEQERKVGNEYVVDVTVSYDAALFKEEDLSTSVSYADIYEEIKMEMHRERRLLESVALSISQRISGRWSFVDEIIVRIVKTAPTINRIVGDCGIEYFWKKS